MLGTYRYALAIMVVLTHLGGWPNAGSKAVFGFYLVSGYLMTLVLNQTYGFSRRGVSRFLINRALRIYPPYWLVIALTFLLVCWQPDFVPTFKPEISLPTGMGDWFKNVFIFGMGHRDPVRWIPPTWSLYAELFFYVAMALGLSRGKTISVAWLAGSLVYTVYMAAADYPFEDRYYPVAAASLPFSLGAVVYHFGLGFRNTRPVWALLALGVFLFNGLFTNSLWPDPRFEGFYASLLAALVAQVALLGLARSRMPGAVRQLDDFLGDLAYPIFLGHYLVGAAVSLIFARLGADLWGPVQFLVAFFLLHAFALGLHLSVERPVTIYRDRVRHVEATLQESIAARPARS